MPLVSYSDSDASDSEPEVQQQQQPHQQTVKEKPSNPKEPNKPASANESSSQFQPIVDRSNPRKIRVALPDVKPENTSTNTTTAHEGEDENDGDDDGDEGPARKKPKLGTGLFSGFNSFLPAPKRNTATATATSNGPGASSGPSSSSNAVAGKTIPAERKPFGGLKTGATPGFDRGADAEQRGQSQVASGDDGESNNTQETGGEQGAKGKGGEEEPKLVGKATMFKPLSVSRNSQQNINKKKKSSRVIPGMTGNAATAATSQQRKEEPVTSKTQSQPQPQQQSQPSPKPKINLFSLPSSADEETTTTTTTTTTTEPTNPTTYKPLIYDTAPERNPPAGPEAPLPAPSSPSSSTQPTTSTSTTSTTQTQQPTRQTQTLDNIADDLNLTRAQRRQLFGRNRDGGSIAQAQAVTFNADTEYAANQDWANQTDLAAVQHKAVRPIAPGKHTLQQLVNAASNQREALEESFAAGRRNKKEAGSKYGW